jgi:hypothetical protein
MIPQTLSSKANTLAATLAEDQRQSFREIWLSSKGNWNAAKVQLSSNGMQPDALRQLEFNYQLLEVTNGNEKLMKAIQAANITSICELALNYDRAKLAALIPPDALPQATPANDAQRSLAAPAGENVNDLVTSIENNIYRQAPGAVITRMLKNGELPLTDPAMQREMLAFFEQHPNFDIRTTSVYAAAKQQQPAAMQARSAAAPAQQPQVMKAMKDLQRQAVLSETPAVLPKLMEANITSAHQVMARSKDAFVKSYATQLGGATAAAQVYDRAADISARNETALTALRNLVTDVPVAAINGRATPEQNRALLEQVAAENNVVLNWEALFGNADFCECDECRSVYSPSAYLVELLQFLRNNNNDPSQNKPDPKDITGTVLEKLLKRRPDLGNLQLSCENTNTVLPYIDLVNEVMESFIVHLPQYQADGSTHIDAFNVEDETSGELLAVPQHINHEAYRRLQTAVYPFTLPYHQPVDDIRTLLGSLGTSRHELMNNFQVKPSTPADTPAMAVLKQDALTRAIDAEALGLTREEYVILTRQGFYSKAFYDAQAGKPITAEAYLQAVGVKPVWEYYGYVDEATMQTGLREVKKGFLQRTGISYKDLVELLSTQFINTAYPKGQTLAMLQKIPYTYAYLQSLVITASPNPEQQYAPVIIKLEEAFTDPADKAAVRPWVLTNFASVGKMIVLEKEIKANTLDPANQPYRVADDCDISKVRLKHLDGTDLTLTEYDRLQRFIRLWRKLGWTITEVDKAILKPVDVKQPYDITPAFIHHLVAIKRLLPLTGLPLVKLLTCWADIDTHGPQSLYRKLFLTHNLQAIDPVFREDSFGNYLTANAKISEHIPVLMAALQLREADIAAIIAFTAMKDMLTIENVSILFRYSMLAKLLKQTIHGLLEDIRLAGTPFGEAWHTLRFIETFNNVTAANFKPAQLHYLIRDVADTKSNIAPSPKATLALAKVLHDGIRAIEADLANVTESELTPELLQGRLALLFDKEVVTRIMAFLDGSMLYTSETAIASLDIVIPDNLKGRLTYNKFSGVVTIKGILTPEQIAAARKLSIDKTFQQVLDSALAMPELFLNDTLFGIFPDLAAAKQQLLTPDSTAAAANGKRLYCYQQFLPFLQKQRVRELIIQTLSLHLKLDTTLTEILLTAALTSQDGKSALITDIEKVKGQQAGDPALWNGYLSPAADDLYTFVIDSAGPVQLWLDGEPVALSPVQNDAASLESKPLRLKATQLYQLKVAGLNGNMSVLFWKTPTVPKMQVPDSLLFPALANETFSKAYRRLHKAALVVNGFRLQEREIEHFLAYKTDFDNIDFNALTLMHWKRLYSYTKLRDSLSPADISLPELFAWAHQPNASLLAEKIAALTGWEQTDIEKLVGVSHFNFVTADFVNEQALSQLQQAIKIAELIDIDISKLFEWAKPSSEFETTRQMAEQVRNAIRARYTQEDWEQVVKPVNDKLRERRKQALIAWLLVQAPLQQWADEHSVVLDANTLFEFFLIDVQMQSTMETSRIKQALSSVQTYIQRCFLGLEKDVAVDALDHDRWQWMQRYRVWEANRNVFLYPENWVEPELRDNKSPFFKELESELLQKDITPESLRAALMNYLHKLDEVGHLEICSVYQELDMDDNNAPRRVHIFGRTQAQPYVYYYRSFENETGYWSPWDKVQLDIQPTIDDAEPGKADISDGIWLSPVVWNNRLLLFWPVITKKKLNKGNDSQSFQTVGNNPIQDAKQMESWQIKLAWSEYKDGKWTPKQTSADAWYTKPSIPGNPLMPLNALRIVQKVRRDYVKISMYDTRYIPDGNYTHIGAFLFKIGNIITKTECDTYKPAQHNPEKLFYRFQYFHYNNAPVALDLTNDGTAAGLIFEALLPNYKLVRTLQDDYNQQPLVPFVFQEDIEGAVTEKVFAAIPRNQQASDVRVYDLNHPYVHMFIQLLNRDGLPGLLNYLTQSNTRYEFDFREKFKPANASFFAQPAGKITFGDNAYNEEKTPYSVYNWELFFHIPLLIADRLSKSQRFEDARKWFHYIFNPLSKGPEPDVKRYWQFLPFKDTPKETLMTIFNNLKPNRFDPEITNWRNDPFNPHMVARTRPTAYMKTVVMKYLDNLVAWGDQLFRQNTLETINEAAMLYVMAAHILGPRPQVIPPRGKISSKSYNALLDKWDAFGNAMLEMELLFPYNNDVVLSNNKPHPFGNIYGFGTALYFGIPGNPKLLGYWDTVADRLFKIRHSMNIDGITQQLPLFEPPINPALLVQAAAMGLSLGSVLNDLNMPMPCYRFNYLIQKAFELCNEVKAMGNVLLSVFEKQDAEALSRLRAVHETNVLNMITGIREKQWEEATAALQTLKNNRTAAEKRLVHYQKLLGAEEKVPGANQSFEEIELMTRSLKFESDMLLLDMEKEELDQAGEAADWQTVANVAELSASVLNFFPSLATDAKPLGVGIGITFGGEHMGAAASAVGRVAQAVSARKSHESSSAARKSGFFRQRQEWTLQANLAGRELEQIDLQMVSAGIRISIAETELSNHRKQIEQSRTVEDFLRNKYTNQELYLWMEGQVRTVYYQAYQLAYDMARKAENAYRFERGDANTRFIPSDCWNTAHDGLMAGDHLSLAIKQLERAYMDDNKREYEITKHISLAQLSPLALINLKEKGICEVELPEELFDMDFPGHYMRRIKTVAVSVPCVTGPYTSVSATLTLLQDKTRTKPLTGAQYAEDTNAGDDRFVRNFVSLQSIATSNAQNDSGIFELNFRDERYLPFEGAGAVSRWRLELPDTFRQFDYDTISDIILHIRYTAREGGNALKTAALNNLSIYLQGAAAESQENGLFRLFSLRHEFANEWYRFLHPVQGQPQSLELAGLEDRLPFFTRGKKVKGKEVTSLELLLRGKTVSLLLNGTALQPAAPVGNLQHVRLNGGFPAFKDKWTLTPAGNAVITTEDLQDAWLIIRYALQV